VTDGPREAGEQVIRGFPHRESPVRQRGWVGLVVILLALVVVAILAKDALKQYGFAPGAAVSTGAATPGERARAPGAAGVESADVGATPASPAAALDRARGVEDMVRRQAAERAARGDGTGN
jgi:hypothetical protein